MEKFRSNTRRYSPRPALAAVGLKIDSLRLLDPFKKKVVINRRASGIGPISRNHY